MPETGRSEPASVAAEFISSADNPTIKLARSLHRKRVRQRERALLVEGLRAIDTAVDHQVRVRTLLLDDARFNEIDSVVLQRLVTVSARTLRVAPDLFAVVAETEHPQPVIAICDMPTLPLSPDSTFVIVCDGVRDPGNMGTLIRSAAAAGADGVVLLPGCVDQHNSKVVRASVGSIFALPVISVRDLPEIADRFFNEQPEIVIGSATADLEYDAFDWQTPVALVIGGEATGESERTRTYATSAVRIPMQSGVESLNAAMAGSILMFEVARQRRLPG